MRRRVLLSVLCLGLVAIGGWLWLERSAAARAQAARSASTSFALLALEKMEQGGFETLQYIQAINLLDQAKLADPDEPRVWIVYSQVALNRGYRIGDRYRADSFDPALLDVAAGWADKGLAMVPEEPMAHVQKAKIQIIRGQLQEAWAQTDRARALQADAFYPWYLRGIVARRMRDLPRARMYLAEAQKRAAGTFREEFVHSQLISVALQAGDEVEAERLYRQLAEAYPPSAHDRYNYGLFLAERKRNREAMAQFEMAKKIAMFPALRRAMAELSAEVAP